MRPYWILLLLVGILGGCEKDNTTYAEISTDFGTMKVLLYDKTPLHKENFIKLAREGYYDGTLFHRVIKDFMIQGGDPDSKTATPGQQLGGGGPGYLIDPEIGAPHIKGRLAAARTPNPEKKSSGSQFYLVQGRKYADTALDNLEQSKGITYNEVQRQLYREIGGTPMLDMEYTVFGEVVEGLEVIDKITMEATDENNRPLKDIKMTVRILE